MTSQSEPGPEDPPGTAQHRAGVERALAKHPKTTVRYAAGPVSIPPLASVRQPVDEIARQAVDVLLAAPDREAARVVLEFALVPRTSCGC